MVARYPRSPIARSASFASLRFCSAAAWSPAISSTRPAIYRAHRAQSNFAPDAVNMDWPRR